MNPASVAGHVLELLMLADRAEAPVDRVVSGFLRERKYLGSRDRRSISDVLFGIIRHRRHIETLLEEFLRQNPSYSAIDAPARRYVSLLTIYSSIHPGLFSAVPPPAFELRSVWTPYFPDLDPLPLVDWAAGAKDLAFLREEPAVTLGVRHSFQDWMVGEWLSRWPAGAGDLLSSLNRPGAVTLRVNRMKTDTQACRERLAGEGIEASGMPYPDTALIVTKRFNQNASACFKDGWYEVQDAGSQVVSLACAPGEGALVIDGCAGAGGKTLHLADLMRNRGRIVAVDSDQGRLRELSVRAKRGGVSIVSTALAKDFPVPEYAGRADVVLVDAPCSGSGTIRRNPSLKWSIREEDVERHARRQLELLGRYAPMVRPGGRLVYSTCSLFRGENEGVVEAFLAGDGAFTGVDAAAGIPWEVERGPHGSVLLLPHRNPTDGFFVAVLERRKQGP
jgi:16S rRNA (cytosine967-C5)-methyltransferase